MPKAVWTGPIVFGLVTVPVRLFPATEAKDVRFHLTDARGRRVRYRRAIEVEPDLRFDAAAEEYQPAARVDAVEPAERPAPVADEDVAYEDVAYEDVRRAYAIDDGRLVVMDREDIEAVRPERSRSIEIEDFVDLRDIDPVYFEKSYHVAPQRASERPYALLLRALERSGRVGIGRFVLRTKPHLVAIRPADGVLGLETLFFGDEVRDGRELVRSLDAIELSERELDLAVLLIDTLHTTWDPAAYRDTYREELLSMIAEKDPVDVPVEPAGPPPTGSGSRVEELMEALKASVEAAKQKRRDEPSRRKPGSTKRTA